MSDPTKLTPEEIDQYRQQFAGHPEALDALDLIAESDGDLTQSTSLLVQEQGIEMTRGDGILENLAEKSRNIICDEAFDDLMSGLLEAGMVTLVATGQIPEAIATPLVIYLARRGVKKFCGSTNGET